MGFCLPPFFNNYQRQERFQLPPNSNLSPSPSPFCQYNYWRSVHHFQPMCLPCSFCPWCGWPAAGQLFPRMQAGLATFPKADASWVGPARDTSQLGGGQEEVQSCRTRLPLSFPAVWSSAYSDTALGCCRDWAPPSAVLTGKKNPEGFLDSIIIPLFIHLKYSKCNYLHNLSQGNECVGGNVSGNVIH